jgi:hypothetical protein
MMLHHPEHFEDVYQINLTFGSMPQYRESSKCHEFKPNRESMNVLDSYLDYNLVEIIVSSMSQLLPSSVPLSETDTDAGPLLSHYIA